MAAPKRRHSCAARRNSSSLDATERPLTMHLPWVFLSGPEVSRSPAVAAGCFSCSSSFQTSNSWQIIPFFYIDAVTQPNSQPLNRSQTCEASFYSKHLKTNNLPLLKSTAHTFFSLRKQSRHVKWEKMLSFKQCSLQHNFLKREQKPYKTYSVVGCHL